MTSLLFALLACAHLTTEDPGGGSVVGHSARPPKTLCGYVQENVSDMQCVVGTEIPSLGELRGGTELKSCLAASTWAGMVKEDSPPNFAAEFTEERHYDLGVNADLPLNEVAPQLPSLKLRSGFKGTVKYTVKISEPRVQRLVGAELLGLANVSNAACLVAMKDTNRNAVVRVLSGIPEYTLEFTSEGAAKLEVDYEPLKIHGDIGPLVEGGRTWRSNHITTPQVFAFAEKPTTDLFTSLAPYSLTEVAVVAEYPNCGWQPTGVAVLPGQTLSVQAVSGQWCNDGGGPGVDHREIKNWSATCYEADGRGMPFAPGAVMVDPSKPTGALLMRIDPGSTVIPVGTYGLPPMEITQAGQVTFAFNDAKTYVGGDGCSDNQGTITA
ncbi:MAG TPA: hypothetical protein PKW90_11040, partial [Myxococcota bacterium]|nr:hypothetical protein [Myxococcota bacterium]